MKCNDFSMLIRHDTLWPWPLTPWPWTLVLRASCLQAVYKIWAKSNNPRQSYWRYCTFAPFVFFWGGDDGALPPDGSQGCVDWISSNSLWTQSDYDFILENCTDVFSYTDDPLQWILRTSVNLGLFATSTTFSATFNSYRCFVVSSGSLVPSNILSLVRTKLIIFITLTEWLGVLVHIDTRGPFTMSPVTLMSVLTQGPKGWQQCCIV